MSDPGTTLSDAGQAFSSRSGGVNKASLELCIAEPVAVDGSDIDQYGIISLQVFNELESAIDL